MIPNTTPAIPNNDPNSLQMPSHINQYVPYYVPMFQYPQGPYPPIPQMPFPMMGYPPYGMYPQAQRLPTPFNYSKNPNNLPTKTEENEGNQIEKPRKPDPFKNKTADQIVNEFKAFTLPKLRLHRLIKLQARIRGWLVRRFVFPKKKFMDKIMREYVEKKVQELVEDKIIPDIVLEILTYNKYNEDVSLYSTEYRMNLEIMEKICRNVIVSVSRSIAQEATDSLVSDILKKRDAKNPKDPDANNPLTLLSSSMLANLMRSECTEIVKECCKEISEEYIIESHFNSLVKNKFIQKPIMETINEAIDEIILEDYIDKMIVGLSSELANPLAVHLLDEFQAEHEAEELNKAMDNYNDRGIIEVLMEQLGLMINNRVDMSDTKAFLQQINLVRKGAASNVSNTVDKSLLN